MNDSRAERIRALRKQGFTLREIGRALGVSKSAVNRALYPAAVEGDRELNRRRQRGFCRVCGKACSWNRWKQLEGPRCADCYHASRRKGEPNA